MEPEAFLNSLTPVYDFIYNNESELAPLQYPLIFSRYTIPKFANELYSDTPSEYITYSGLDNSIIVTRGTEARYKNLTIKAYSGDSFKFYFQSGSGRADDDMYFSGPLTVSGVYNKLTRYTTKSGAAANAVTFVAPSGNSNVYVLPDILNTTWMRLYHQSVDGITPYRIYQFLPRTFIQVDDLEAEVIDAVTIRVSDSIVIGPNLIGDKTILGQKIVDGTLSGVLITNGTVTGSKIEARTISGVLITAGTIKGENIEANTISGVLIAANTIKGNNIEAGTISGALITAGTITSTQIATSGITAVNLAADSITTDKLTARVITVEKIAVSGITSEVLAAQAVTSAILANGAVVSGKIAADSITGSNIIGGVITGYHIAGTTITFDKIASRTLTSGQIADGTITGRNILAGTLSGVLIEDGTITGTKVQARTISGSLITAGTIKGENIEARTISGALITVGTLKGENIEARTISGALITAGTIKGENIEARTISGALITVGTLKGENIEARTISGALITVGTLKGENIQARTISGALITVGTLKGENIEARTISGALITAGTIKGENIEALTISGALITAGTITATNIAVSGITADRLNVTQLDAVAANMGTLIVNSGVSVGTNGYITVPSGYISAGKAKLDNTGLQIGSVSSSNLPSVTDTLRVAGSGTVGNIVGMALYNGAFSASNPQAVVQLDSTNALEIEMRAASGLINFNFPETTAVNTPGQATVYDGSLSLRRALTLTSAAKPGGIYGYDGAGNKRYELSADQLLFNDGTNNKLTMDAATGNITADGDIEGWNIMALNALTAYTNFNSSWVGSDYVVKIDSNGKFTSTHMGYATIRRTTTQSITTAGTTIIWNAYGSSPTRSNNVTYSTDTITIANAGYYAMSATFATVDNLTSLRMSLTRGTVNYVSTLHGAGLNTGGGYIFNFNIMFWATANSTYKITLVPSANTTLNANNEGFAGPSPIINIVQLIGV